MKINLQKIVSSFSCHDGLQSLNCFKQINIYRTIDIENTQSYKDKSSDYGRYKNSYKNNYKSNNKTACNFDNDYKNEIEKIEPTIPDLQVITAKVIDTPEGTSLEGQVLSGKKLILVGDINLSLIIAYSYTNCNEQNVVKKINIPFTTFIVIPKDICLGNVINLRYLIEDVTAVDLQENKIIVSVTFIIQYVQ